MANVTRATLLATTLLCGATATAHAAPRGVVAGENMVVVPLEMQRIGEPEPRPHPRAHPQAKAQPAPEDNMVVVEHPSPQPYVPANDEYVPITGPNYVEAGVNFHNVSNNQGDWFGQFITGQYQTDKKNRWNLYLQHQKAFKDDGFYIAGGNTHTFDETWFSDAAIGFGTDAAFLPAFRADAAINRRWLEGGPLVTTAGINFSKAQDKYTNYGVLLAFSYYFPAPFVLQGGVNLGLSNPGQVVSNAEFIALTYGYQKQFYLTGKVGIAHEAYQLLGTTSITNAFNSQNAGINWRHWLGEDWGYNLASEFYKNPYYHRTGGIVSVFKEF